MKEGPETNHSHDSGCMSRAASSTGAQGTSKVMPDHKNGTTPGEHPSVHVPQSKGLAEERVENESTIAIEPSQELLAASVPSDVPSAPLDTVSLTEELANSEELKVQYNWSVQPSTGDEHEDLTQMLPPLASPKIEEPEISGDSPSLEDMSDRPPLLAETEQDIDVTPQGTSLMSRFGVSDITIMTHPLTSKDEEYSVSPPLAAGHESEVYAFASQEASGGHVVESHSGALKGPATDPDSLTGFRFDSFVRGDSGETLWSDEEDIDDGLTIASSFDPIGETQALSTPAEPMSSDSFMDERALSVFDGVPLPTARRDGDDFQPDLSDSYRLLGFGRFNFQPLEVGSPSPEGQTSPSEQLSSAKVRRSSLPSMSSGAAAAMQRINDNARFSVDVAGLLEALTEQFPEPLLCVRELIQNAADAGSQHINVDISYDESRSLVRLSVTDDGRGMNAREVEGYLTIGLSEKDPKHHRGRFGIGKLSPYALGFQQMVVETCDGRITHRLEFKPDGSGQIELRSGGESGTIVRIYKTCSRSEAEELSSRTFSITSETCGSIVIPLRVNGVSINREPVLSTPYVVRFEGEEGKGVIGVGVEPHRTLLSGGIVLESGASVLGQEISYILDASRLSPTLSRNAVRRDRAFDELVQLAQAHIPHLVTAAVQVLRQRVERLRTSGAVVERALEPDDRAALEWLRARLLDAEQTPQAQIRDAPVLETADGDLVSANTLISVLRSERRIPTSRVPRTRDEIGGHVDRGVPVLLLYRDLEDFLQRQAIPTVEVDGLDDGMEVEELDWGPGEVALIDRPPLAPRYLGLNWLVAIGGTLVLALSFVISGGSFFRSSTAPELSAQPVPQLAHPPVNEQPEALNSKITKGSSRKPQGTWFYSIALSAMAGILVVLIWMEVRKRRQGLRPWLREEAKVPIMRGEDRRRRLALLARMLLHPIDFAVARGWSTRASRDTGTAIAGYRAFAPEPRIRSGARLDLDRIELGYVDLLSRKGDPSDARMIVIRGGRVLLNRYHPTVASLIQIAESDPVRARVLLDALLATDSELARGCDPRQVEWDLVGRAPRVLKWRRL